MKKFYVYLIKNTADKKNNGYVGKTFDPKRRWNYHIKILAKTSGAYLHRAMRKYGIKNFTFKVISIHKTETAALNNEIRMIEKLNTFSPKGYNLTIGGDGVSGYRFTSKQRAKISAGSKAKWKDLAYRAKVIAALKGKPLSPEHRAKVGAAIKAMRVKRPFSIEHRKKLSRIMKGKMRSIEVRTRISNTMKALRSKKPFSRIHRKRISDALKGIPLSDKHKKKISISMLARSLDLPRSTTG